ncbi:MAG: AlpA family phage regulatory protein [Limimaricola sp.]|uniref:helix-turn-helix transcriptional regulator n=1 Tax=Limimaricola sp. TaxID=2211665 RepID=UPI001DE46EA1|nr:AlpA family phage regulatory protein [Limimaricola sp.]MBI1415688.1 AlpA family phage regulatory protein [Limimaricola sp.]
MRLLSFTQLRNMLGGRSRSSIYRDWEKGRLPRPIKIGSRLYWRDDEVRAAVEDHRCADLNKDSREGGLH